MRIDNFPLLAIRGNCFNEDDNDNEIRRAIIGVIIEMMNKGPQDM